MSKGEITMDYEHGIINSMKSYDWSLKTSELAELFFKELKHVCLQNRFCNLNWYDKIKVVSTLTVFLANLDYVDFKKDEDNRLQITQ